MAEIATEIPEIKYGGCMRFYDSQHNVLAIQGRDSNASGAIDIKSGDCCSVQPTSHCSSPSGVLDQAIAGNMSESTYATKK